MTKIFITFEDEKKIKSIVYAINTNIFLNDDETGTLIGFSKEQVNHICEAAIVTKEYTNSFLRILCSFGQLCNYPHGKEKLLDGKSYPSCNEIKEITLKARDALTSRGEDL